MEPARPLYLRAAPGRELSPDPARRHAVHIPGVLRVYSLVPEHRCLGNAASEPNTSPFLTLVAFIQLCDFQLTLAVPWVHCPPRSWPAQYSPTLALDSEAGHLGLVSSYCSWVNSFDFWSLPLWFLKVQFPGSNSAQE
ncbi:hypothetical protein CB1_000976007 [Camelus ferus]|nr:hypothetical protein CB1_000976007 [Camelus ferus]